MKNDDGFVRYGVAGIQRLLRKKNLNVVDESFIFSDVPYSSIHDAID